MRSSNLSAAVALALLGLSRPVPAAEITKAECDALHAENAALVAAGVPKLMEKGPEWAKANLRAADLDQIRRLIHVSEQITFRCETIRPVNAKIERSGESDGVDTIEDTAPADAARPVDQAATAARPPAKATTARPGGPPKPDAAAPETAKRANAAAASAKPQPKPAPKPKAKVNDAYVPPAGEASTLDGQATSRP